LVSWVTPLLARKVCPGRASVIGYDFQPEIFHPMISSPEGMKLLEGRLIVSCQAPVGDPFYGPDSLSLFARAAVNGGAAAIRTDGPESVTAIKAAVAVPVIGLLKRMMPDGLIMITPTDEDATDLVAAGADFIAIDCTSRGQRNGALRRIQWI
jgi:putative N-acetylmannosamine-6-phosphate epimerase